MDVDGVTETGYDQTEDKSTQIFDELSNENGHLEQISNDDSSQDKEMPEEEASYVLLREEEQQDTTTQDASAGDTSTEITDDSSGLRIIANGQLCADVTEEDLYAFHHLDIKVPIACDFCSEEFEDMDEFDNHMAGHSECRFFSCQLCCKTYQSWGNLVAHRKACHRGEVLSCEMCGMRKNHPGLGPVNFPVASCQIGCEECHEGFTSVTQLYRHYKLRGSHGVRGKLNSTASSSKPVEAMSKSLVKAGVVGKLIPAHFEAVSMAVAFECTICNTQFFTEEQLQAHMAKLEDEATCYTCNVCQRKFCSARVLVSHRRSHPDKVFRSHVCPYCGKVLRGRTSYIRHRMIHTGERPFRCDWCCKSFNRKSALESHKYSHPLREAYCCFNCQLSFQESYELKDHIQKVHYQQKGIKLICDICGRDFMVHTFMNHYKECHMAKETQSAMQRRANVTCPICNKVFSQPTALNRHLKLHNPTLKKCHTCEVCGKTIMRRYHLYLHVRQHYGDDDAKLPEKYKKMLKMFQQGRKYREAALQKSFICEYCGREFNKKFNLSLHIKRHTGERPYNCQLCGKEFYTNQQLAIHVRQHTGERPYECMICKKTFTGPNALYMHRQLHNKVKKYKCQHCDKEFFWRSAFIGHVRLHTGERPYQCTLCSKTFTLKGKLNLHMKKHNHQHTIHRCEDCGEHFGTIEELTSHLNEQCCVTMVTYTEEEVGQGGSGIVVFNLSDGIGNQISIRDDQLVEYVT